MGYLYYIIGWLGNSILVIMIGTVKIFMVSFKMDDISCCSVCKDKEHKPYMRAVL